jgi:Calcineurin-like phosphoesterase
MRPRVARLRKALRRLLTRVMRPGGGAAAAPDPRNGAVVHEILDPAFLRQQLEALRREGTGLLSEEQYRQMSEQLDAADASPASGADATSGRQAFMPRSANLSILQSTLTACVVSRVELVTKPPPGRRSFAEFMLGVKDVFRQFGPCDAAWIESVVSKGISLFEGRAPFVDDRAPDVTLSDRARIVIAGDWGSGLPGARAVGERMADAIAEGKSQGRDVHALHLGDVYYSGWKEEYETRFLPWWPVRSADEGVPSWALNGNHDMYSGGHGYFGYLLREPRFAAQAGSSYFCLQTPSWQLLGLDTAYEDAGLAGKQAEWVAGKVRDGGRRTMLLSHHQPFSSYGKEVSPAIVDKLAGAGVQHVDAWLWGHEHLCCVYERDHHPVATFGSCVGHGGVPVLEREGDRPAGVAWQFQGAAAHHGQDRWQLFGYAVLDFDGPRIDIRYFDENGALSHAEQVA